MHEPARRGNSEAGAEATVFSGASETVVYREISPDLREREEAALLTDEARSLHSHIYVQYACWHACFLFRLFLLLAMGLSAFFLLQDLVLAVFFYELAFFLFAAFSGQCLRYIKDHTLTLCKERLGGLRRYVFAVSLSSLFLGLFFLLLCHFLHNIAAGRVYGHVFVELQRIFPSAPVDMAGIVADKLIPGSSTFYLLTALVSALTALIIVISFCVCSAIYLVYPPTSALRKAQNIFLCAVTIGAVVALMVNLGYMFVYMNHTDVKSCEAVQKAMQEMLYARMCVGSPAVWTQALLWMPLFLFNICSLEPCVRHTLCPQHQGRRVKSDMLYVLAMFSLAGACFAYFCLSEDASLLHMLKSMETLKVSSA